MRTSNTESPVSRDSAAISRIMVPAHAVHVSRDDSSFGLFNPYLKLICKTRTLLHNYSNMTAHVVPEIEQIDLQVQTCLRSTMYEITMNAMSVSSAEALRQGSILGLLIHLLNINDLPFLIIKSSKPIWMILVYCILKPILQS